MSRMSDVLLRNQQCSSWITVGRHLSAMLLYGLAIAQWPNASVAVGSDGIADFNLSTATFTLVFWSACFYHYAISAGRVSIDWERYRFRARGWIVKSSRRTHRVILVIGLAVASATVVQSASVYSFYTNTIVQQLRTPANALLLKTDFIIALMLAVFIAIRLCLEPNALIKRRRQTPTAQTTVDDRQVETTKDEIMMRHRMPTPTNPEECQICVERMANRQLNCGHILCCCCLLDLIRSNDETENISRCPFCRQTVIDARRLLIVVDETTPVRIDECCSLPNNCTIIDDV